MPHHPSDLYYLSPSEWYQLDILKLLDLDICFKDQVLNLWEVLVWGDLNGFSLI
jgi:hypothetical protein